MIGPMKGQRAKALHRSPSEWDVAWHGPSVHAAPLLSGLGSKRFGTTCPNNCFGSDLRTLYSRRSTCTLLSSGSCCLPDTGLSMAA